MPTNEAYPLNMYSINGIPIFTYGMLGLTTIVLAYVTFMDDGEGKSFANPADQPSFSDTPPSNNIPKEESSEFVGEPKKEEPKKEETEGFFGEPKKEEPEKPENIFKGGKHKKTKRKR